MNISLIHDSLVKPDKTLTSNVVSAKEEIDTLEHLAYEATRRHITCGTFHHSEYLQEWVNKPSQQKNVGLVDSWKRVENLEQIQILCFDFDKKGQTSKQIHEQLKDVNHLILASKSHLLDKLDGDGTIERFHVFIPVDEPITSPEFYKFICKNYDALMQWDSDKAVFEASHYFYRHKAQLFIETKQQNKSVARFKSVYAQTLIDQEEQRTKRVAKTYSKTQSSEDVLRRVKHKPFYQNLIAGKYITDGDRHNDSWGGIGMLVGCGMPEDQILSLIRDKTTYGKSFTDQYVIDTIHHWQNK